MENDSRRKLEGTFVLFFSRVHCRMGYVRVMDSLREETSTSHQNQVFSHQKVSKFYSNGASILPAQKSSYHSIADLNYF